jgi:hypothetical protein
VSHSQRIAVDSRPTNLRRTFFEDRDDRELNVTARLKPGTTVQQAQIELALLAKTFERAYPQTSRSRGAAVHTQFETRTREDDGNWKFGVIFVILALAVLLVACNQRCRTSAKPCAHANANRCKVGDWRRAFPAYPAAVDRKPDSGGVGRSGRDRHRVWHRRVVQPARSAYASRLGRESQTCCGW